MRLRVHAGIWAFAAVVLVFKAAARRAPEAVERIYGERVGPAISGALDAASAPFSFSVTELLTAVFLVAAGVLLLRSLYRVLRRRRRLSNALVCGLLQGASLFMGMFTVGTLVWGLNSARPTLTERLQWDDATASAAVKSALLESLCRDAVDRVNDAYFDALGTEDIGVPSRPPEVPAVQHSLAQAYRRVADRLRLDPAVAEPRGPVKPYYASRVLCYLQLTGFYSGLTGEAMYNQLTPACWLPHTLGHEMAHQRGFLREDEANFLSFLACIHSDDPYARYSGYLFASEQLLSELASHDRGAAKALLVRRYPGVVRDEKAAFAFRDRYSGIAARVNRTVIDANLKMEGIHEGAASYRRSSRLIVLYAQHNGGSLAVHNEQAP